MSWTTFPDVYAVGLPQLEEWAATVDVTQPDKATEAFFPTIARDGLAYNLLLLQKVRSADVGAWRDLFGAAWTAGAGCGGASRPAVRDRSPDLRDAATPAGRRRSPLHAEHRRRPGAGRGDQGSDARAHPRRRRWQPAEDLQPTGLDHRLRLGLRPPGGQGLGHRLRHLDRSRLPVAHRHRRHADDDVRDPLGEQSGSQAARAAVELPDPLRRRAAVEVERSRAADVDRDRPGSSSSCSTSMPTGASSSTTIRRPRCSNSASPSPTSRSTSRGTSTRSSASCWRSGTRPAATWTPTSIRPIRPTRTCSTTRSSSGWMTASGERGRRQHPRPAGHGIQGGSEARPPQPRLPHHRPRLRPPVAQR